MELHTKGEENFVKKLNSVSIELRVGALYCIAKES